MRYGWLSPFFVPTPWPSGPFRSGQWAGRSARTSCSAERASDLRRLLLDLRVALADLHAAGQQG